MLGKCTISLSNCIVVFNVIQASLKYVVDFLSSRFHPCLYSFQKHIKKLMVFAMPM